MTSRQVGTSKRRLPSQYCEKNKNTKMHRFAFLNPIATPLHLGRTRATSTTCTLHRLVSRSTFTTGAPPGPLSLSSSARAFHHGSAVRGTDKAQKDGGETSGTTTGSPRMSGATDGVLKHVVIAGGTGFLGSRLAERLLKDGSKVTILTRDATTAKAARGAEVMTWAPSSSSSSNNGGGGWVDALKHADGVVNLCGVPVVSRWTTKGKQQIISSRVDSTTTLVNAITTLSVDERPKTLVNASGVGYYGTDFGDDVDVDESVALGGDFLADICKQWEGAANAGDNVTRVCILRFGVVVGAGGGALAKMIPAYQLFVGGPLGSGKQWMSWVHVDDAVSVIVRALREEKGMKGAYNCTSPNPVTMGSFCSALAGAMKRPNLFAVPEMVLNVALGEAAMVLTKGQRAVPKRLEDEGFQFEYAKIDDAMKAVVREL